MGARSKRVLILGGTGEARQLASLLVQHGCDVITALAGRTHDPALPEGAVRHGGFGGADGLAAYLQEAGINFLADATHPFAAQISANGVAAAKTSHIPVLRLERPQWQALEGDDWHNAQTTKQAARMIAAGATALVTVGRQEIGEFLARSDVRIIARMIEPPGIDLPDTATVLLARPPFTLGQELDWFTGYGIDVLVTKNSGGKATSAKLAAARKLGKPVIMIARPELPPAPVAGNVAEMADAIAQQLTN